MKVIVDCDPGVDDLYALALICVQEDVDILAITTVHGNTEVNNCTLNAKLLLDKIIPLSNKQPPIYRGASKALSTVDEHEYFYGKDGLAGTHGTSFKAEIDNLKHEFLEQKKSNTDTHAAVKIVELINKYPQEVTIIALGPLTNLALASRLCQDSEKFSKSIKKLIIMGGTEPDNFSEFDVLQINNPEFNFRMDPLAAKIVLEEYLCPIKMYTFDCCLRSFSIEMTRLRSEFQKYENGKRCNFIQSIGFLHAKFVEKEFKIVSDTFNNSFFSCDFVAAAGAFYDIKCEAIYKKLDQMYTIDIENNNRAKHGSFKSYSEKQLKNSNIEICIKMNQDCVFEVFKELLNRLNRLDQND